ncbi:TnsA endonuclease N-terminal domain-containing protein [Dyella psychrodurans]|uniref:Integrase catalytic domain-containing protein n=1 Tax=Dyella psychrodurans TaxID=1927960 RepID=A0A370X6Y9_9GAMM|nr:TnsA endonuclease N-terminal domain-containing protein [Dyella psychrodurans]RDS84138.1 hypothetical protein DWU99_10295 [Dyella psychrodurans]
MTALTHDIEGFLERWNLPEEGAVYIRNVRCSPPARRVASNGCRNTVWRYASYKMRCTISAESTLEKAFLSLCEYDDDVLEYWEQPTTVSLVYPNNIGRTQRVAYTPDVLVLKESGPQIVQIKPYDSCKDLVEQRAHRWAYKNGGFQDTVADEYFSRLGLLHIVITDRDISQVKAANVQLLLQARRAECKSYTNAFKQSASEFVQKELIICISKLMDQLAIDDQTLILKLIDDGIIFANLDEHNLVDRENQLVALSKDDLKLALEAQGLLSQSKGVGHLAVDKMPRPRDAADMVTRLRQINLSEAIMVSVRTLRRWREDLRRAGGDPLALVPQHRLKGRREPRMSRVDRRLVFKSIEKHYGTKVGMTPYSAFRLYVQDIALARKKKKYANVIHISFPTFLKLIRSLDLEKTAEQRGGNRAANAAAAPVSVEKRSPGASRPFERVHIDHYLTDQHIVLVIVGRKKITGRLWLTLARDEYTGAIVGMSLSFYAPSRISCATVLRDIVRRYGRLPEVIVVDNGKEFDSIYFETLLAKYGVSKQSRPPGAPRFGSTIETIFRKFKSEFLNALPGSTSNDERGRSISSSHRGQAGAEWTLTDAFHAYEKYFLDCVNEIPVRGGCESPWQLLDGGFRKLSCLGIRVEFDKQFLISSAIPVREPLKVDPQRGVRHNDHWYSCPELFLLPPESKVDAMWEPWDWRCLYVLIGDKWISCYHGRKDDQDFPFAEGRMMESILHLGSGSVRAQIEEERNLQIANQIAEGTRRAKDRAMRNVQLDPKRNKSSSTKQLPTVKTNLPRFDHFDDTIGGQS